MRKASTATLRKLEAVKVVWNYDLPLFGSGENRWFYQCRPKDGGPNIGIQEKYLKQAAMVSRIIMRKFGLLDD